MIDDLIDMFLPWVILIGLVLLFEIFQSVKTGGFQSNKGNLLAYFATKVISHTAMFLVVTIVFVLPLSFGISEAIEFFGLPQSRERENSITIGLELVALLLFLYVAFKPSKSKK